LEEVVSKDQLLERFGGAIKFDHQAWLASRASIEAVVLPANNAVVDLRQEYNATHSSSDAKLPFCVAIGDYSAAGTTSRATFTGNIKKRGFHNTKFKGVRVPL
jgi:hypothetical protein